jgi:hypothetical protein
MKTLYSIIVITLAYLLAKYICDNFKIDLGNSKQRRKRFLDK